MTLFPDHESPVLMGIVNVTPDSFADGGRFMDHERAVQHALTLIGEGAGIVDIGGESTRPGATPVSAAEEMDRVIPVIEGLKGCGAMISVDTRHAQTMKAAIAAGAGMVNDVTALCGDPESLAVVASSESYVCLMHMQGRPETMQNDPRYINAVDDVFDFLGERIRVCESAGLDRSRIIADPGIGFGKGLMHNLELIRNVSKFRNLGVPVMLGTSRKSFIGAVSDAARPEQRLPGSLATVLWGLTQGVRLFRVHDVAATKQAIDVWQAIRS